MSEDKDLLRQYACDHAQDAFAELVRRHIDLVYGSAFRRLGGDAHLASDVTQSVFTDLARKAETLSERDGLAGWLYTAAKHASAQVVRAEERRRKREEVACSMEEINRDDTWTKLRPVVDEAMDQLSESDRLALLLRFFENLPLASVGAQLALSEDAARKRVDRALDRLRAILIRSGISSTSAAIGTVLIANATMAAPASLTTEMSALTVKPLSWSAATWSTITVLKGIAAALLIAGMLLGALYWKWTLKSRRTIDAVTTERAITRAAAATQRAPAVESAPSIASAVNTQVAAPLGAPAQPGPTLSRGEMLAQARTNLDGIYRPIFHRLDLPSETLDRLRDLLVVRQGLVTDGRLEARERGLSYEHPDEYWNFIATAEAPGNQAIAELLGKERYEQFSDFEKRMPKNITAMMLQNALKDIDPISDEKREKLVDVLIKDGNSHQPIGLSLIQGAGLKTPPIGGISLKAIDESQSFLNPVQVEALRALRSAIYEYAEKQAATAEQDPAMHPK
jgi:RNA polymerase sigma factor (sigma-70 family)